MFSRIRHAAAVLSYSAPKVHPRDIPDIVFTEERCETAKASRTIGGLIEALCLALLLTFGFVPLLDRLLAGAGKSSASILTLTGFAVSVFTILGIRILEKINHQLRLQLKIGEKVAPYFGHKITRAIQIIRG